MYTQANKQQKNHNTKVKLNTFVLFLPEIKELLRARDFSQLKDLIKRVHSIDIAEGWMNLTPQEKLLLFKLLSFKKAVEVFEDLDFGERSFLLNNLANEEVATILNDMAADERARLFKDLPHKIIKKLFFLMKNEEVADVRRLLTFKEGTAGSIMTSEFVSLKKDMTARKAILHLQESSKTSAGGSVFTAYVVDDERHLIGQVGLQELITAPPDMLIKDIMSDTEFIKLHANASLEEVTRQFTKYDLLDCPIVNDLGQLIGIITFDDVADLIKKETTKEFYEIGKMGAEGGKEIRYATATVRQLINRRAGWLVLLLVFDFLTGTVLKTFEHALSSVVALAFFIPMLLDTGGNAGAQTSITIIRGFATGDVRFSSLKRVVKLELNAAFVMAIIVGVVAFMRAKLLQQDPLIAIVVGLAMSFIVLLAIATGILLPIISKKVGLDPAVLAGPITTSVVDVVGLIIYFKIAQLILPALGRI